MVTEQMKTDAQRFGNGKKGYNAKQVAEMLENAGGGYTAGTGITISEEKAISVDTTTIQAKMSAGTGIAISGENVISALEWKICESKDEIKSLMQDNYTLKEDMLVCIVHSDFKGTGAGYHTYEYIYIRKGTYYNSSYQGKIIITQGNTESGIVNIDDNIVFIGIDRVYSYADSVSATTIQFDSRENKILQNNDGTITFYTNNLNSFNTYTVKFNEDFSGFNNDTIRIYRRK